MNVIRNDSISSLIALAEKHKGINRYSTPVIDYYTGKPIMGVHLFKPIAVPNTIDIEAFRPERWIDDIRGVSFKKIKQPFINHGFNSNRDQCIRFGLHRGLKAFNAGPRGGHWHTILDLR